MKLSFDHAYTSDASHRFHTALEKMGFKLHPIEVEHPNQQFCRFINFRESMNQQPVYLEFVDARDKNNSVNRPGLSLRANGSLKKYFQTLSVRGIEGRFTHINYDWKIDSKSSLPGLNFVTFKNLGFRSLFPWITEYEDSPKRKRNKMKVQRHPNSVRKPIAIEISINPKGEVFFEKLLARVLKRTVRLPAGQTLYFSRSKTTTIKSIVLEAHSLTKAKKFIRGSETIWRGRPALKIENPSGHWDLIIVGPRN